MVMRLIECVAGLVLAGLTLRDVFDTVVVPGRAHGSLKIPRRIVLLGLALLDRGHRRGVGVDFAPLVLLGTFVTWMLLLVLAFGLMAHAFGDSFRPAVTGFGEALYVAGSSMATIGVGRSQAAGPGSVVAVAAGFCGLAVMTMAVTYLLEVQSNIAHRDAGVLKISTSSGQPPSALTLLERYAALECRDELPALLRGGRDWCATVLQSHASHPSLIYFRSAHVGAGWPATLGALVDLALVFELLVDEPGTRGASVLLREQGVRLAGDLCVLLRLQAADSGIGADDVVRACSRLERAGYRLRPDIDAAGFAAKRQSTVASIEALARHLRAPNAPFVR